MFNCSKQNRAKTSNGKFSALFVDIAITDCTISEWDCPNCHAHHDRDVNAVKNISVPM
nr:zinc ribbon domain-containing protein [Trichococcus shcherbakoviae]